MKNRFSGLDVLKSILAFLVICIHIPFPGEIGVYFVSLTRVAVPMFFMISGFFYDNTVQKAKSAQQIKKIFHLIIVSNSIFFLWKVLYVVLSGNSIVEWLKELFTIKNLFEFLFLNVSHINGHLWYLNAILYTLIIMEIFRKRNIIRCLYPMIPILLGMDLVFGKYSLLVFGKEFNYILVRNFMFVGIPYFLIGMLLFKHKERLLGLFTTKKLMLLGCCFIVSTLLERCMLENWNLNATRDSYLSTTLLAVAIFLFFLKFYTNRQLTNIELIMEKIGREKATYIYILHPIMITILNVVARKCNVQEKYRIIAPIVVYICSVIIVSLIQEVFKNRKKVVCREEER